ncbi:hypothetical protein Tco_0395514, partial [Tanacetum coccineum]
FVGKGVSNEEEEDGVKSEVIYDTDGNDVDQSLAFELLKPDQGETFQVADALHRRQSLVTTMKINVKGFESLRDLYQDDFKEAWSRCDVGTFQ